MTRANADGRMTSDERCGQTENETSRRHFTIVNDAVGPPWNDVIFFLLQFNRKRRQESIEKRYEFTQKILPCTGTKFSQDISSSRGFHSIHGGSVLSRLTEESDKQCRLEEDLFARFWGEETRHQHNSRAELSRRERWKLNVCICYDLTVIEQP